MHCPNQILAPPHIIAVVDEGTASNNSKIDVLDVSSEVKLVI